MSKAKQLLKKSIAQHTLVYDAFSILLTKLGYADINLAGQNARYRSFKKLEKKYSKYIGKTEFKHYAGDERQRVWTCWLQGMESAPALVKACYASMQYYIDDFEIVVITADNYKDYVTLPDYIIDKWQKGIISNTHFSDILRLELLIEHGGLWLDATTYLTDRLPDYISKSDFFVYRDGFFECEVINMGNWLIKSNADNILLQETQSLLLKYWKEHNYLANYFIFQFFFRMVTSYYSDIWKSVPYFNQINAHIFQMELCDSFNKKRFNELKSLTPIHKLSYKIDEEGLKPDSYYNLIDKLLLLDNEKQNEENNK